MNLRLLLACAAATLSAVAQPPDFSVLQDQLRSPDTQSLAIDTGELSASLAALTAEAALLSQTVASDLPSGVDDPEYAAGTSDLDAHRYEAAIRHFNAVIDRKASRVDSALYWKAYALNRSGRHADALATIARLRSAFPQSRWLGDARALQAEINAKSGHPVDPGSENNEELKLIAVNGLLQSDPARALPILQALLHGNQSPGVKDRALFVLSQSRSPEASQTLLDLARGKADPDLQVKAIRYIGMMGAESTRKELVDLYSSSSDNRVKREIIHGYLLSGAKSQLLAVAKSEPDKELRLEAVRALAQTGAKDELWTLYKADVPPDLRREIVRSMLLDDDSAHLLEIAKTEKDLEVRRTAIQTLALTTRGGEGGTLAALYRSESDTAIKRELIRGLFLQQNARALVDLARQESNPELKREIVQQLSLIHSKDATDYLMEILK